VEVPFIRPDKLSGDYVTDLPVFKHCLSWMNSNEGYCPDILVHLRPTAPMRTCENIDSAIKLLLNNPSMDSIRSVTKVSEHPMKMWKKNSDKLTPFITDLESGIKESYNMPRQKLPNVFIQNGSVDVIWARTILEKDSMSGEAIKPYIMDERNSINIDTELDFYLAEILIRNKSEN